MHAAVARRERHLRRVSGYDRHRLVHFARRIDQYFCQSTVGVCVIVESSVRLDALDRHAFRCRDFSERGELMDERAAQFACVDRHRLPSEVLAVRIRRMSAEDDAASRGCAGGVAHRVLIAGMPAAGDIRRVDQRPQLALDGAPRVV